jgi:hypothetical protein
MLSMTTKSNARPKGRWTPEEIARNERATGVEHIVVGGFAVNAHGFIRVTKDLDICTARFHRDARTSEIDGLPVRVCGLDHLRAMKRAAGRPRDLEDLKGLGEG